MLKKKSKILLIFIMLFLSLTTINVFAENEEEQEVQEDISEVLMQLAEEEETNLDDQIEYLQNQYKEYYSSYLGKEATSSDIYKIDADDITIDQNVSGNIFIIGNKVTIKSEVVHGDVYILAKEVNILAYEIAGSVYVTADSLKIEDTTIDYSLYTAADKVSIYGSMLDMYATADEITIEKGAVIQRDLHTVSSVLNLYGLVCRNAYAEFEKLNILSEEELSDEETISGVFGNFEYSSSEEVSLPDKFVGGEVKFTKVDLYARAIKRIAISILSSVIFMISVFYGLKLCANKFVENSSGILADNLGKVVLKGLGFIVLIPLIIVGLILLELTIKVALLLLGIYLIVIAISTSVCVIALAEIIANKFKFNNKFGRLGIFILVSILYAMLLQVPYVGAVIAIVIATLGVGIIIESISKRNKNKMIPESSAIIETSEINSINEEEKTEIERVNEEEKTEIESVNEEEKNEIESGNEEEKE